MPASFRNRIPRPAPFPLPLHCECEAVVVVAVQGAEGGAEVGGLGTTAEEGQEEAAAPAPDSPPRRQKAASTMSTRKSLRGLSSVSVRHLRTAAGGALCTVRNASFPRSAP